MSTLLTVVSNLCIITLCQKYVFVDDVISSLDADAECLSRHGTHLASIHNAADNAQAQALCKPQPTDDRSECWIGLHDFDVEPYTNNTLFKWYDGTPIDYQNWQSGEPNEYYQEGEDLVSIMADTGQWQDEFIDRRLRLICWNPLYLYKAMLLRQSTKSIDSTTIEPTIIPNILSAIQFEHNEIGSAFTLTHGIFTAITVVFLATFIYICVIGVYLHLQRRRFRKQTEEIVVIAIKANKANVNQNKNAVTIVYDRDIEKSENDNSEPGSPASGEMRYRRTVEGVRSPTQSLDSPRTDDMDEIQNNPNIADDEFIVVQIQP